MILTEKSTLTKSLRGFINPFVRKFIIRLHNLYNYPTHLEWHHTTPGDISSQFEDLYNSNTYFRQFYAFILNRNTGSFSALHWRASEGALFQCWTNKKHFKKTGGVTIRRTRIDDCDYGAVLHNVEEVVDTEGATDVFYAYSTALASVKHRRDDRRYKDNLRKEISVDATILISSLPIFKKFQQDYNQQIKQALDQNLYAQVEHLGKGLENLKSIIVAIETIKSGSINMDVPGIKKLFSVIYSPQSDTIQGRLAARKKFITDLATKNFDLDAISRQY